MKRTRLLVVLLLATVLVLVPGCGTSGLLARLPLAGTPQATPGVAPAAANTASGTVASLAALEGTLQQIYQQVSPSVVGIRVTATVTGRQALPDWPFPNLAPQAPQQQSGEGSGFVWDKQGHIVTNNHVVENADTIKVTFVDGLTVSGKVVGTDPDSDLAVVKVDLAADRLQPVRMGDSTQLKVGNLAVAIGQPFGLENTMTVGFVSALGRSLPTESSGDGSGSSQQPSYTIPDVIQTDAPINPGNSGGVLLNDEGQVIGVTSAIVSPVRASAGIGFAVPSAIVQKIVPVLIEKGRYVHPWLGISGTNLSSDLGTAMKLEPTQRGALVVDVVPGGPADKAGLRGSDRQVTVDGDDVRVGGDVIVAIDGQPMRSFDEVVAYLVRSTGVGQKVKLTVLRDGREQQVEVTLSERPNSQLQQASLTPQRASTEAAWLGITGVALTPTLARAAGLNQSQRGILILDVSTGSPAEKAGLRGGSKTVTVDGQEVKVGGDVIVGWNGRSLARMQDLRVLLAQADEGQEVTLTLLRGDQQIRVNVTLGASPTD